MDKQKLIYDTHKPFSVVYDEMTMALRALLRSEAARAWNCNEDTVRRRIKGLCLRPYEHKFITVFCSKHNIVIK